MFKSWFSHHIAMTLNVFKPMSSFVMWEKHTHVNVMRQHKRDIVNTVSEYSKFSKKW